MNLPFGSQKSSCLSDSRARGDERFLAVLLGALIA